ncbi:MAG: HlyC/CorC family transporter [Chloroflexi bacterium]|nr:MAG: HlyC/CorC family transporter [Chloroflexota bacterium]
MNDDSLSGLLLILLFLVLQAVVSMAHAVLVNARLAHIREQADAGNNRARKIIELVASPQLTITFYTVRTTLHFMIVTVTILGVVQPLLTAFNLDPIVLYATWLFLVGVLVVIFGDIVPEAVGSTYANVFLPWAAGLMYALVQILKPLILLLLRISKLVSAIFKSGELVNTITEEEIMTLVDAGHTGGTIEDEEKDMIYSVLQLDQTRVSEMMVPRIDIVAIEINQTLDEAGELFVSSGYSRLPIYEKNLDTIKGLLYAKDLLAHWSDDDRKVKTVSDLMRPVYFVPESKRADELLKELQAQKVHLAIVIDEYGGTAGLVTIEDIIEQIIGDIQDEYDFDEEDEYQQLGVDEYMFDASIDLDDFNDMLDVNLPTDDSDTLGGYIYTYFGRVPLVGEVIETQQLHIEVIGVEGRRIRKVHVIRKHPDNLDEVKQDASNEHD